MADKTCKEKKYTFVQETIRPKKKSRVKKVAFTIGMAVLFGMVSCIVFCFCLPLLSEYFDIDSKQIIIGKGEESEHTLNMVTSPAAAVVTAVPTILPTVTPSAKSKKTEEPDAAFTGISSERVKKICDKVNPSIVKVDSMKDSYDVFSSGSAADTGATCGIVVGKSEKNLLIYVNKARIDESQKLFVTFQNNKVAAATIYSKQEELGIAILAVELSELSKEDLDTVEVADFNVSEELSVGKEVIALGNPNGHMYSFASGYISNAPYSAYIVDNSVTLINTTIDFNTKGDGVLVNLSGEIIGFITHVAGFVSELNYEVNTCYSVRTLKPIITKLVNKTPEIYMGVTASDITPEIAYKTGVSNGLYITGVQNNSPAFFADLKKGDILTKVEGETVTSVTQFNTMLNQYKENDKVTVTYLRMVNGTQVEKKATVLVSVVK